MYGARSATLGAALVGLFACARPSTDDNQAPVPQAAPAPAAPPVDHLAPGELAEGTEHAFGLVLPGVLHIDATFSDLVTGSANVIVHPLTKYFRAHLQGGTVDEGDTAATFDHTSIPAAPSRVFRIHIQRSPGGSLVEIRDVTPPPFPDLPDEAARWRAAGVTPDGHLIVPKHVD